MTNKVAVIGGAGFLGSHIADALTANGCEVTIFDQRVSPWLKENQKMVVGNILDGKALNSCLVGQDYVFHAAGVADISQASENPVNTIKSNVLGTTIILDACVHAKIKRFVFTSTIYVYSEKGSFYRASKQAAEGIIEAYQKKFNLDYTILRYGSLYGPRAQDWNGLRSYVRAALATGKINYSGTGEERREYIHITDAASMTAGVIASDDYANQCFMFTGTQALTARELTRMLQELIGGDLQVFFIKREDDDNGHYCITPYRYTPKRATKMTSTTFVDLGEGILEIVQEISEELVKQRKPVVIGAA